MSNTSRNNSARTLMTLPWPARLWKPGYGAVETSLGGSLRWRISLSGVMVLFSWMWALNKCSSGGDVRGCVSAAVVITIFTPLLLLVMYPHQLRREVKLPFRLEITSNGLLFKTTDPASAGWPDVEAYAICDSEQPGLKRLEVLVKGKALVFPFDTDETDEEIIRNIFSEHLPGLERRTICSVDFKAGRNFLKN